MVAVIVVNKVGGHEFLAYLRIPNNCSFQTLDCIVCRSAVAAFVTQVNNGQTDDSLSSAMSTLCFLMGIQTDNVCRGAVSLNIVRFLL